MPRGWENFYVLVGTASAGLIGLFFVVAALSQNRERSPMLMRAIGIYMSPTVLNFAVVFCVAAVAVAPAFPIRPTAAVMGLGALFGLGDALWACAGMAKPRPGYEPPHWSDFWLYGAAPVAAHIGLAAGALALWSGAGWAPMMIAATVLALLLVGVRNAWDLVTWIAPRGADPPG